MRQKPGCNTFPSSAVGLMTAQPEIHKLWLAQTKKTPPVGGAKRQASRAKATPEFLLETCR